MTKQTLNGPGTDRSTAARDKVVRKAFRYGSTYQTNDKGEVTRLFFAYAKAIHYAQCFPDVLLVDATYKTMPSSKFLSGSDRC
jgi:hypothetical protein